MKNVPEDKWINTVPVSPEDIKTVENCFEFKFYFVFLKIFIQNLNLK